jgi:hypothetical protein
MTETPASGPGFKPELVFTMNTVPPFHESIAGSLPTIEKMCGHIALPRMRKVHQRFPTDSVGDVAFATERALRESGCLSRVKSGDRIALGVGSRGLASLPVIVSTTVETLRGMGARPFIVPAMGSHGGATAEGQLETLKSLGVTEAACGAPIFSSMETVCLGEAATMIDGVEVSLPLYIDRNAYEADGIIPINRIKPHTAYRGNIESGLCKMLVIGLGKHDGAMSYHRYGFGFFHDTVPRIAELIIAKAPILFGIASVENAYHQVAQVEAIAAETIKTREPALLKRAFQLMGRIYLDHLDTLIIDQIGKDISGDGLDPNISGTFSTPWGGKGLEAASRVILGMTEGTHNNFIGLGLAEITTLKVFLQLDPIPTYINALTSRLLKQAKIPLVCPTEKSALQAAIFHSTAVTADNPRVVRIKNTSEIDEIAISESLWAEAEAHPNMTLLGDAYSFDFDEEGMLIP